MSFFTTRPLPQPLLQPVEACQTGSEDLRDIFESHLVEAGRMLVLMDTIMSGPWMILDAGMIYTIYTHMYILYVGIYIYTYGHPRQNPPPHAVCTGIYTFYRYYRRYSGIISNRRCILGVRQKILQSAKVAQKTKNPTITPSTLG